MCVCVCVGGGGGGGASSRAEAILEEAARDAKCEPVWPSGKALGW